MANASMAAPTTSQLAIPSAAASANLAKPASMPTPIPTKHSPMPNAAQKHSPNAAQKGHAHRVVRQLRCPQTKHSTKRTWFCSACAIVKRFAQSWSSICSSTTLWKTIPTSSRTIRTMSGFVRKGYNVALPSTKSKKRTTACSNIVKKGST